MLDKKVVDHIAKLARLEVSDSLAEKYALQIKEVMEYFDQLSSIPTDGVEPLITPTQIEKFYREDLVVTNCTSEEMLQNAPEKIGNLFKVPPAV